MSDSHDNLDAIRKAVDAFNKAGVDLVIHAGDMISPFTAKEIQNL
ncbi:MAG TPA: metallophosphoesterase family protein, partial [Methanobacterium sp.]|nr:metallophosphoesterase family protein [Methanobacterium sp.]